jgi:hypothetical protein
MEEERNSMTDTKFFKAVEANDLATVTQMVQTLDKNHLHEIVNDQGQTPLMVAVLQNNLALATILLEAGFDPSQKDVNHLSPFVAAAANGFDQVFSVLISAKPDPTQVNRFGGTALLPASEKGYLKAVQLSLAYGVPVNHQNRLGWSALLEAVILGDGGFLYQEIIQDLVSEGGDVHAVDFDDQSAVQYALERNQTQVQKILEGTNQADDAKIRQLMREERLTEALVELYKKTDSLQKLYYLGSVYERLKDAETAQYYFEKGLENDAQFAFYLANLNRKQGKVEEALAYFKLGAARTTDYYFDYHRSNYLRELGRHEEAVALMDKLLTEYPKRTDFMFHKANSLRTLGDHQAAYDTMIEAATIQPQNPLFMEQAEVSKILM